MTQRMHGMTGRAARAAWACALGVLLGAGSAAAQSTDPVVEFQSYQLPGWSFTPSLAFGTTYDSNVALSSPRAEDLGRTEGDTLFTIVPGAQLEFHNRRTDFSANYRGYVRRYSDFEGLDGFDSRASVNARRVVKRRLTLSGRVNYGDSPTTDDVELNGVSSAAPDRKLAPGRPAAITASISS